MQYLYYHVYYSASIGRNFDFAQNVTGHMNAVHIKYQNTCKGIIQTISFPHSDFKIPFRLS